MASGRVELTQLRDSFITQIEAANDKNELKEIEKNIDREIEKLIFEKTGYNSSKEAGKINWDTSVKYTKDRMEIIGQFEKDGLSLNKRIYDKLSQLGGLSHIVAPSDIVRGGKCKSRGNLKNKKLRKTRRKSTRKRR